MELVPVDRGDDGTLTMFQNRFTNMLKAAIQNVSNKEPDDSTKELYHQLKDSEETKKLRKMGIKGPFPRDTQPGQRSDEILLKEWAKYYHFLAHVASTRSSSDSQEGALLIDSKTFKVLESTQRTATETTSLINRHVSIRIVLAFESPSNHLSSLVFVSAICICKCRHYAEL